MPFLPVAVQRVPPYRAPTVLSISMRLGPWVLMRMHPAERELHKVHQLTPALRELVAKMARSLAKDAIDEIMEAHDLIAVPKDRLSPKAVVSVDCTMNASCQAANCEFYCGTIQPRRQIPGVQTCGQLKCPICTERDPNGVANTKYAMRPPEAK